MWKFQKKLSDLNFTSTGGWLEFFRVYSVICFSYYKLARIPPHSTPTIPDQVGSSEQKKSIFIDFFPSFIDNTQKAFFIFSVSICFLPMKSSEFRSLSTIIVLIIVERHRNRNECLSLTLNFDGKWKEFHSVHFLCVLIQTLRRSAEEGWNWN